MSSKAPPPSLDTLPIEILDLILSFFCCHCLYGPLADFDFENAQPSRDSLKSLLLTSKRLSAAALTFVYHQPCWHMSEITLIKTLASSPNQGCNVKELEFPIFNMPWIVEGFTKDKQIAHAASPSLADYASFYLREDSIFRQAFFPEMILALAPNASVMRIEIRYCDDSWMPVFDYLTHRLKTIHHGTGFDNVRYLELSKGFQTGLSISNPAIFAVLSLTTNLTRLKLCEVTGFSIFSHNIDIKNLAQFLQNLLVLEFKDSAFHGASENSEFEVLRQIIKHAPRLNSFKFQAVMAIYFETGHNVPPETFVSALLARKTTLRSLCLDFGEARDLPAISDKSLVGKFTGLETLELDDTCFCRHSPGLQSLDSDNKTCLAEILPLTVKRLHVTITTVALQPVWSEIIHLGKETAQGKFPSLEHVEIQHRIAEVFEEDDEDDSGEADGQALMKDLRAAFKDTRVTVKLSKPDF